MAHSKSKSPKVQPWKKKIKNCTDKEKTSAQMAGTKAHALKTHDRPKAHSTVTGNYNIALCQESSQKLLTFQQWGGPVGR
jgi:hypothetical protein